MKLTKFVPVSFSFPVSDLSSLKEFDKLAEREGKDRSKIIQEFIKNYVKEHANNPVPKLDKFVDPEFSAWPTLADRPTEIFLDDLDEKSLLKLRNHAEEWEILANRKLKRGYG